MPTALVQKGGPTASPTPSATLEVEVDGLGGDTLGTDLGEEFQQDQHLLDFLVEWDWQRLLSSGSAGGSNDTAPSMPAVEEMTNSWYLPVGPRDC